MEDFEPGLGSGEFYFDAVDALYQSN